MPIMCLVAGHHAFPSSVRNQGFYFSQCRCCGRDMIRSQRGWRKVPKGFRVVWRREASIRNLPVVVAAGSPAGVARRLAAAADLAGTALRGLIGLAARRLRAAWQASMTAPLRPRALVLRLPAPAVS
jgi:cell division protein FtsZ